MPDEKTLAPYPASLAGTLLAAREAVMAPIRPCLRSASVTDQQWRVLRVLAAGQALDAGLIAKLALLHPPTVTRILRELTHRGLLSRAADPEDRRRTLITVTPEGIALVRHTAQHTAIVLRGYETAFGAERLANLMDELRSLTETLAQFSPSELPAPAAPS
jgi:homoprotocatechuate degradation regulator HpaR